MMKDYFKLPQRHKTLILRKTFYLVLLLSIVITIGIILLLWHLWAEFQVAGVARDAITLKPLPGAKLIAGETEASTDASGRFLISVKPNISQLLVIAPPGYENLKLPLKKDKTNLQILINPAARLTLQYWLEAFLNKNYKMMYELLSADCQAQIDEPAFAEIFSKEPLHSFKIEKLITQGNTAKGEVEIVFHSAVFGKISYRDVMRLMKEGGRWKVCWYQDDKRRIHQ